MRRVFPRRSRSALLPLYLVLGLGNLVFALLVPDPAWAVRSFFGITLLLLLGVYLRWGPAVICFAVAAAAGVSLGCGSLHPGDATFVILGTAVCGSIIGLALELAFLIPSKFQDLRRKAADEPILAELVEPRHRPPAKVYSVPRRYDLSLMLVVVACYAMLFSVMQMLKWPPAVFVDVALFFTLVGTGQALLFGGKKPRLASEVVGTVFFFVLMLIGLIVALRSGTPRWVSWLIWLIPTLRYGPPAEWVLTLTVLACSPPVGFFLGYLAGTLIGGIFLIADAVRSRIRRAPAAETDAEGEAAREEGNNGEKEAGVYLSQSRKDAEETR